MELPGSVISLATGKALSELKPSISEASYPGTYIANFESFLVRSVRLPDLELA
jgi:hypothetical protein